MPLILKNWNVKDNKRHNVFWDIRVKFQVSNLLLFLYMLYCISNHKNLISYTSVVINICKNLQFHAKNDFQPKIWRKRYLSLYFKQITKGLIWPYSNNIEDGSCSRNCNTQTLYSDLNYPNQAFGECVANC